METLDIVESNNVVEEVKYHWWLVSYAWFQNGKHGYGNYTHGTTLKIFDNSAHDFAKKRISSSINTTEFVLISVSYLGEMTKLAAIGEK